ncbi:transposase [Rhizobium rhizogenes]|uniref:transposase n=1 Tax=Rhizobium rhizogenes TaxID=359 RepID=UPI0035ABBF79
MSCCKRDVSKRQPTHGVPTYGKRAGIEGTLSQGIRAFGLRRCRYIGLSKTRFQHVMTALAMNVARIDDWLTGGSFAKARRSAFAQMHS